MARGEIVAAMLSRSGVAEPAQTVGDPGNGHFLQNDGRVILQVQNTDGAAAHTVTFEIPGFIDTVAIPDPQPSIPASTTQWFGPWPVTLYDQPGGNQLWIDTSDATMKFRALRVPF